MRIAAAANCAARRRETPRRGESEADWRVEEGDGVNMILRFANNRTMSEAREPKFSGEPGANPRNIGAVLDKTPPALIHRREWVR